MPQRQRKAVIGDTLPHDDDFTPREKIYAAALACFSDVGVRQATMEDIARAAGLSRATIYYYFKDKRSLIVEAVIRQQAESHRLNRQKIAGLGPLDALVEAAALSVERAFKNPYITLLTNPENERLTAEALKSDAAREVQAAFWTPLLANARKRKMLRTDLSDQEAIEWIMFLEFSIVTHGHLLGATKPDSIRNVLDRFLRPSIGTHPSVTTRQATKTSRSRS